MNTTIIFESVDSDVELEEEYQNEQVIIDKKPKEELGSLWFSGKGSLERCLKHATENKLQFITARDTQWEVKNSDQSIKWKGAKIFGAYKSVKDWWKLTESIKPTDRNFYEVIPDNRPIKLYADVEFPYKWKTIEEVTEALRKHILKVCVDCDYDLSWEDVYITEACDDKSNKGSLHLVSPSMFFNSTIEQGRFWNRVFEDGKDDFSFIEYNKDGYRIKYCLDMAVYNKNREMRTVGSCKMKDGKLIRPLMITPYPTRQNISEYIISDMSYNPTSITDISKLPELTTYGNKSLEYKKKWTKESLNEFLKPYNVEVDHTLNGLIELKNIGIRKCLINKEDNISDRAWLTITKGQLRYWCFDEGCRGQFHILDQDTSIKDLNDEIPWHNYIKSLDSISQETSEGVSSHYKMLDSILEELNNYLCVIIGSSKPYFISRTLKTINTKGINTKIPIYTRYIKKGLIDAFENHTYNTKKTKKSLINTWILWCDRRTFQEEVFVGYDTKVLLNQFNTFRGYNISKELAFEHGKQDVSNALNFIKDVWCQNNETVYKWLIQWFGYLIQHPLYKMSSCIVVKGPQGVGKSMVFELISKIIGSLYYTVPSSADDILGNFNSICDRRGLIYLDELVWGGNKKSEGTLKKLITGGTMVINEKGLPQRNAENVFNLAISSNEQWVIPASDVARRFLVLEATENKHDKSCIWDCCPFSMAKYLYTVDLLDFKHDEPPTTLAKQDQQDLSMDKQYSWFVEQIRNHDLDCDTWHVKGTIFDQYKSDTGDKYTTCSSLWQHYLLKIHKFEEKLMTDKITGKRSKGCHIPPRDTMITLINTYFKRTVIED